MLHRDIQFVDSVEEIGQDTWNRLCTSDYPFLDYRFLHALESSRCVGAGSGWQPFHAVVKEKNQVVAVMPLYKKLHSFGEYVFDWAWADAYLRHGIDYYPKLVTAIPFTPATGPRLCLAPDVNEDSVITDLVNRIQPELERLDASSWHCLFPPKALSDKLAKHHLSQRLGCQYHWLNEGFSSFDDFLATFSSRKRKNLRRERRRVAEQGLELSIKEGKEVSEEEWQAFYRFYHLTYYKRSGRQGYLNQSFFLTLAESMPDKIMMVQARHRGELVAGSLFFHDKETLYGRYWGCNHEFEFLHFEACYYQGIDYAIDRGLKRFDPGAQGEHKIQRGFTPVPTWSNHWIARPEFREAIDRFLGQERPAMEEFIEDAKELLPFKNGG